MYQPSGFTASLSKCLQPGCPLLIITEHLLSVIPPAHCSRILDSWLSGHEGSLTNPAPFVNILGLTPSEVYDLAAGGYIEKAECVFLIGPAGVGKTHLAQALGHEAVRKGIDVLYTRTSRMLAHINAGRADGTIERRLNTYIRTDLLILDDFGLKPMRPPATEDLYEVIEGRYGSSPIILTTNRAFDEWLELFDQPVLGSAAIDRLAHGAHQIVIPGESYRARGGKVPGRKKTS